MKVIFIINPISGVNKKNSLQRTINQEVNGKFDYEIFKTQYAGHGNKIACEFANKVDVIVAIGGDGTILEIGSALINTKTALAIIPCGSGNGLARNLKIPLSIKESLHIIHNKKLKKIDTGIVNDSVFLSTLGFGFDAHIAKKFSELKTRGFWSYFKLICKEYNSYPTQNFEIIIDDKKISKSSFILCIANSSQYGNGAIISPKSIIDDGMLEVCFLRKPRWIQLLLFPFYFFGGSLHKLPIFNFISGKNISILKHTKLYHKDGDTFVTNKPLNIKINPLSLDVIVP